MSAKKLAGGGEKATTVVVNDPNDRKGTLKLIGGSQSDCWSRSFPIKRLVPFGLVIRMTRAEIVSTVRRWQHSLASDLRTSWKV